MRTSLSNPGFDFEYYIKGTIDGQTVTYPVTGGSGVDNIKKPLLYWINQSFLLMITLIFMITIKS